MDKKFIKDLKDTLSIKKNVLLIPHSSPDADALGSCLALYHFLRNDHEVHIISPNEFTEILKFLPSSEDIIIYDEEKDKTHELFEIANVIFTLDFNSLSRAKNLSHLIAKSSARKIMIDHHQNPENYCDLKYSDPKMSSTSEMVYDVINSLDSNKINLNIAYCLYTGIVADTGSFRFPSTTSKTLLVGSKLVNYGVNVTEVFELLHNNFQFSRLKLLGITLNNFKKVDGLPIIYTCLSEEDQNKYNFKKGDSEGFVNFGLTVNGIVCSVIFIENKEDGLIKISFRSKGDFKVNIFASKYFNGGGHEHAAGGISKLNLNDTEAKFLNDIKKFINEN
jgi:phosphoesterase RecJ-like protein